MIRGLSTVNSFLSIFLGDTSQVIPLWLDLAAVIVGSISGGLVGCEHKLDLIGVTSCAVFTGLGGGLIRDVTMQMGDVYFLNSPYAIPSAVIAGIVIFYFHGLFERIPKTIEWVDIVSVALFVIVGADKALHYNLSSIAVVFMGFITGVGGGMLRDSFIGDVPKIFRKSNFYAICALVGAIVFCVSARYLGTARQISVIACLITVVGLRRLSLRYNWQSPAEVDWAPKIIEPVKKVARKHHSK